MASSTPTVTDMRTPLCLEQETRRGKTLTCARDLGHNDDKGHDFKEMREPLRQALLKERDAATGPGVDQFGSVPGHGYVEPQAGDSLVKPNGHGHPIDATIGKIVTDLAALAEQRHAAELLVKENHYVVGFAEVLVKAVAQMADRRPVDEDILRELKIRLDAWAVERGLAKPNGGGS